MNRTEIETAVNRLLVEDIELDAEKLNPNARMKEDLGIESLDIVDIAVLVNQQFHFKMKIEDMKNIHTLTDFYDYIEHHVR